MDVQDLSALLHMQNQSQALLHQLQNRQSQFKHQLDSSVSSISSISSGSQGHSTKPGPSHNVQSSSASTAQLRHESPISQLRGDHRENENELSRSALASKIRKQNLLNHLEGRNKLDTYRRVSNGDKPGGHSHSKLAQGIENNKFQFGDAAPLTNGITETHDFDEDITEAKQRATYDYSLDPGTYEDDRANTSVTFQEELELLGSSDEKPSTPKTRTKPMSETPRSILKHRKIIDDNIHVASKYQHTPVSLVTPRGKYGLNYSYSDVGDPEIDASELSERSNGQPRYSDATDGSYMEEYLAEDGSPRSQASKVGEAQDKSLSGLEAVIKERLLLDSGNDRKNAGIVRDLSRRPKSYVFESAMDATMDTSAAGDATNKRRTPIKAPKHKPSPKDTRHRSGEVPGRVADASSTSKLWQSRDQPLLGYDWIAGNLDNEGSVYDQSDEYFREMKKFRTKHKMACAGDSVSRNNLDLMRPISPEIQDPAHKCLHGFTVNDRLFTEPLNADDQGRSMCPVCLISREEPTQEDPGFVRVSIPRSTLEKPYRIKPHRRRSFDATDSYALSQHCLAGYECSVPTTIPTAKNIDIKGANGIQGKQAMTLQEAEDFVKSHSRKSRLMSRHPSQTARSQSTNSSRVDMSGSDVTSLSITRGLEDTSSRSLTRGPDTSSRSLTRGSDTSSRSLARGPDTSSRSLTRGPDTSSRSVTRESNTSSRSITRGSNNSTKLGTQSIVDTSSITRGLNTSSGSLSRRPDTHNGLHKRETHTSSRSVTRGATDSLLDTSRNLRYDLQDMARRKGKDKHKRPHSTEYPVF